MVSICNVHGVYYSLMLPNHTSFCTWKVLHYHFIASVQKADMHLCKSALFESPAIVEDKLRSTAVNVYKPGVYEAPLIQTTLPSCNWEGCFNYLALFATDG